MTIKLPQQSKGKSLKASCRFFCTEMRPDPEQAAVSSCGESV